MKKSRVDFLGLVRHIRLYGGYKVRLVMNHKNMLEELIARAAHWLTRIRKKRIFHADGIAMTARIEVIGNGSDKDFVSGTYSGVIRISRGITYRSKFPDILGLAFRIDNFGSTRIQDFLFLSASKGKISRYIPWFYKDFTKPFFTTILPYRVRSDKSHIGAKVFSREKITLQIIERKPSIIQHIRIELYTSTPQGWRRFAVAYCDTLLTHKESNALAFNPWNTAPYVQPLGFIHGMRDKVYREAQKGRK